jgi:pyruvate-ferredoxin/flavodoxin oxidoreductase
VETLRKKLESIGSPEAKTLAHIADYLVRKSVWAVGGDGWAYDIGYGGLDHTLAIGRDLNLLVLDTGVYSNTGGQASKATPLGAVAKFAMGGKAIPSKDLGMMAMAYGHVYVASVAFGAKDSQTVRAFLEAESYPGPSMIIAYSHCIAHGYNMSDALDHQKAVVECGAWPMYRFDPRRTAMGENPLKLDSRAPKISFKEWALTETRFRMLAKINPERSENLLAEAQRMVQAKYDMYQQLANLHYGSDADAETN